MGNKLVPSDFTYEDLKGIKLDINDKAKIFSVPKPHFLIKSISEQGYSFQAALADLIDNSVSATANRVEVIVGSDSEPFQVYLADDGVGMSSKELVQNMQFPSSDPSEIRNDFDLGRFGLGMKAASFSQTRKFTVLSRTRGTEQFHGLVWDVEHLERSGVWEILVCLPDEVSSLIKRYTNTSRQFLNYDGAFVPNTIVIWDGLYKFEEFLSDNNKRDALNSEVVHNTSEHLGIVFHRFIEEKRLNIRVNNFLVKAFNPFPTDNKGLRKLEFKQKHFGSDSLKMEGFVLPSASIEAAKQKSNCWTTPNKSLLDMEGVYIYRENRLIIYGGWNGLIRKAPRRQLARLKVDIGNKADHLFHLNVAKSQLIIPHELIKAFRGYVDELVGEAEKEFYNRGIRRFADSAKSKDIETFLKRTHSSKGPLLELNENFPLMRQLTDSLDETQTALLSFLVKMINININKVRKTHEDKAFYTCDEAYKSDVKVIIENLLSEGFSKDFIKSNVIKELGIDIDSLPPELLKK